MGYKLLGKDITDAELEVCHDDLIDDLYGTVQIGIYEWDSSRVLKMMDPVAYRISVIEYVDQLLESGDLEEM